MKNPLSTSSNKRYSILLLMYVFVIAVAVFGLAIRESTEELLMKISALYVGGSHLREILMARFKAPTPETEAPK